MGAGQNQRFVAGPGSTLATYPVAKGQACACRDKPRQRLCNKPRVSYLCNRGFVGAGLRAQGFVSLPYVCVSQDIHWPARLQKFRLLGFKASKNRFWDPKASSYRFVDVQGI